MDPRTQAVRDLYEKYPYPSGQPQMRVGFDARFVLAQVRLARPEPRPIEVLDAGCGRALGLLAAAELQPDVRFTGVDFNRRALEEARNEATTRGLENLRFAEVNLETLENLKSPPEGFEVIISSGVVHHMLEPVAGLERLRSILAPHGVIVLTVYGTLGRQGYEQVRAAIDAVAPADAPLETRLKRGRALVRGLAGQLQRPPWAEAARADDVEFVDRYLHVREQTYTVPKLFDLIEGAGLAFLSWCLPDAWSLVDHFVPGPLRESTRGLDERARASLIEQVTRPRILEAFVVHPKNGPRPRLKARQAMNATFIVNPEITFDTVTRPLLSGLRVEAIRVQQPNGKARSLPNGPLSTAALLLRDQVTPFSGQELVDALQAHGLSAEEAGGALFTLVNQRLLYRPHPVDVPTPAGEDPNSGAPSRMARTLSG